MGSLGSYSHMNPFGKCIPLCHEYSIQYDGDFIGVMHRCPDGGNWWVRTSICTDWVGRGVMETCIGCEKKTPSNIIFMYKLWMFNNETGG